MTARISGATSAWRNLAALGSYGLLADRLWLSAAVLAVHVFERTHRPTTNQPTE